MKPRVRRTQFTSCFSVGMGNTSYFFLFLLKTILIRTNNLMLFQLFQYIFTFKITQILSSFLLKNTILHQKLHKDHQKLFYQVFEDILTFQIP